MKITSIEIAGFKALVKATGVYHLCLGAAALYRILLGLSSFGFSANYNWQHETAWAFFFFAVALALLFGTDTFCRLTFRPEALAAAKQNGSA
jgi:hypothetical protein